MKHYLKMIGTVMVCFWGLFAIASWLEIPIISDPGPWLERKGPLAAVIGVGLLTIDVVLPIPATLIMIAHGALFGMVLGTALSLVGATASALLAFTIGRSGSRVLAKMVPEDELSRANSLLDRWGGLAVVVSRPVPVVAETVAILAGASLMSWTRMVLATLAGALPTSFLYALAGATAAKFDNKLLIFALVLVMAAIFWALGAVLKRSTVNPAVPASPDLDSGVPEG